MLTISKKFNLAPIQTQQNADVQKSQIKLHSQPLSDTVSFGINAKNLKPLDTINIFGKKFIRDTYWGDSYISAEAHSKEVIDKILTPFNEGKAKMQAELKEFLPENFVEFVKKRIDYRDNFEINARRIDASEIKPTHYEDNEKYLTDAIQIAKDKEFIRVSLPCGQQDGIFIDIGSEQMNDKMRSHIIRTFEIENKLAFVRHNGSEYCASAEAPIVRDTQLFKGLKITQTTKNPKPFCANQFY